jgi:hypothetical protein
MATIYKNNKKIVALKLNPIDDSLIDATATIDNNVGTPSVIVTPSTVDTTKIFNFKFSNLKGDKGDKGDNGKDGTNGTNGISCTHKWDGTTLTVTSASGTSSANLKGEKGNDGSNGANGKDGVSPHIGTNGNWYIGDTDTGVLARGTNGTNGQNGAAGVTPVIKVASGNNIGTAGTPSVNASTNGNVTTFTFDYLKGNKGDPGKDGTTPTIKAAKGNNIAKVGTPAVTATTSGTETTFTFDYLKGERGEAGKNAAILRQMFTWKFAEKGIDHIEYYSETVWQNSLLGYVPEAGQNVWTMDSDGYGGLFEIVGPVVLTSGSTGYGVKLKSYTSLKGPKGDASTVPGPKGEAGCSFSLSGTTLTITWNT